MLTIGCTRGNSSLTPAEQELVTNIGFDPTLMARVRASGTGFERLLGNHGDGDVPAAGLVLVTRPSRGEDALRDVRLALDGTGYGAWLNENAFGFGPDKVAIMKSRDDYTYLHIAHTDGVNLGIDHEQVLARYREWQVKYGLRLDGAGIDWLAAKITRPPPDWLAFSREVYAFCPDVVDQGTNSVEKLAAEMRTTGSLYLWWD